MPCKNYCVLAAFGSLLSVGELEGSMGGRGFKQPLQSALVGGRQRQGQFYTVRLAPSPLHFSE